MNIFKGFRSHMKDLPKFVEDEDGLLYRKESEGQLKLVIPESLVESVIRTHHYSKWAGHAGIKKTKNCLRSGNF
jgi:hypothetical protein